MPGLRTLTPGSLNIKPYQRTCFSLNIYFCFAGYHVLPMLLSHLSFAHLPMLKDGKWRQRSPV